MVIDESHEDPLISVAWEATGEEIDTKPLSRWLLEAQPQEDCDEFELALIAFAQHPDIEVSYVGGGAAPAVVLRRAAPPAPVIYVWPYWPFHCYKAPGERIRRHPATAAVTIRELQAMYPGHTIDLSAEPPEGISR